MKITTFDPIIVTSNFDEVVSLFEALGFEKKHAPVTDTGKRDVRSFRMKHPEGYHVDVADVNDIGRDMTYIRMNVDNFDEAYDIFMAQGKASGFAGRPDEEAPEGEIRQSTCGRI